ncbi:MAG: hypothetical protein IPK83_19290 [Planctomycetes bacterium]|nr:hypothetical protein [Planctomycetota bacterium]
MKCRKKGTKESAAKATFVLLLAAASQLAFAATTPEQLRTAMTDRVGSLEKLKVPATDAELPQPDDVRFRITPEKKRLGKLLFFDPIRNNNVRPEFGGNRILAQSSSCGSCHIGLAASKAGQTTAFGQGAQGFGYIDDLTGQFVGTRHRYADLADLADSIGNGRPHRKCRHQWKV